MILGPDGKPVMPGAVIGAPKLTDFKPIPPAQLPSLLAPLEEALSAGVPPSAPTEVPLGTLCLLASSLIHYMKQVTDAAEAGEE